LWAKKQRKKMRLIEKKLALDVSSQMIGEKAVHYVAEQRNQFKRPAQTLPGK
jgi:hypothetical protein